LDWPEPFLFHPFLAAIWNIIESGANSLKYIVWVELSSEGDIVDYETRIEMSSILLPLLGHITKVHVIILRELFLTSAIKGLCNAGIDPRLIKIDLLHTLFAALLSNSAMTHFVHKLDIVEELVGHILGVEIFVQAELAKVFHDNVFSVNSRCHIMLQGTVLAIAEAVGLFEIAIAVFTGPGDKLGLEVHVLNDGANVLAHVFKEVKGLVI
jgi:hypothetical protein